MRPLTKTLYQVGVRCLRRLWWEVHQPWALELKPTLSTQDRLRQASQVGKLARAHFPDGKLIPTGGTLEHRVELTQTALAAGVELIFEAAFSTDHVYVAVDVLERIDDDSHRITEVKASSSAKAVHASDLAIQAYVLSEVGLSVASTQLMHLNPDYIHPGTDLFVQSDVTSEVLAGVPDEIRRQLEALKGSSPPACTIGGHCKRDMPCPFVRRCWPEDPDHVRYLYRGHRRQAGFAERGIESIAAIPDKEKLSPIQSRQVTAVKKGEVIVDRPGLEAGLKAFTGKIGFLDFETVSYAVPRWAGTRPWEQVPAQFSYHEAQPDDTHTHAEWLATGPEDPRVAFAEALVDAASGADSIAVYHMSFERNVLQRLSEAVPHLEQELDAIDGKLVDLLPIVRGHVYHPLFQGSFSVKKTLPALCPDLSYADVGAVQDGLTASVEISRLMFDGGSMDEEERSCLRRALLRYCHLDTWAMVRLREALIALSSRPSGEDLK